MLSDKYYINVGKDKFYKSWNGSMRDVNAVFGPGAYRETNF